MATDGVNITEDAEMAECDGDKVVTMMDVLQEQQDFEEDANAVLGASDDKNCTYAKGYIKRQAIYACLTCCPDAKTDPEKRAGVCLACSLNCHENHELVELYTKRNFRCDCGNPKFNSHPCQYTPSKPDLNDENIYNQNFSGLYCTCQRPYPDPESPLDDDMMIQCIICEDWLHAAHLEAVVPTNDQYSEMICKGCMDKNEFLHDYSNFAVNVESVDVDIVTVNGDNPADTVCNGDVAKEALTNGKPENNTVVESVEKANDVDMDQDKDTNVEKIGEKDENIETSEESDKKDVSEGTKQTEELSADNTQDKTEDAIKMDSENSQNEESSAGKEPTHAENSVEKKDDESHKTIESVNESEQPNEIADGKTETDEASKVLPEEEQKDEQSTNERNDSENAKGPDNDNLKDPDADKTEEQLLEDIKALSSENPSEEETKPSEIVEKTEQAADTKDKEESLINSETEKVDQTNDMVEDSPAVKQSEENDNTTEAKPDETSKTDEKSQPKANEEENTDDKTDSVMDAIDELLKDPSENEEKESKDNAKETEKPNDTENDDKQEEKVPEITDTSKTDSNNTDIEMKDSNNENEPSVSENKVEDEKVVDSESKETVETVDSTIKNDEESRTDVEKDSTDKILNGDVSNNSVDKSESDNTNKVEETEISNVTENKRKLSVELADETSPKKAKLDVKKCVRPKDVKKIFKGATFWPATFRQKLCTCGECISMYKDLHVLFLTDPEDTVSAYESLGKENVDGGASQYEKGLQALSSLDRIQQINALTEYNKMRDKLLDFLKSFKDRKEIVKEEDIKAFFAGMKPRREPDGVYFCR